MRFLCDVDGVIFNLCAAIEELGYRVQEPSTYDLRRRYKINPIDWAKLEMLLAERLRKGPFPLYPGVLEAIDAISAFADIYYVTTPWLAVKHWCPRRQQHLDDLNEGDAYVISTRHKELIDGDVMLEDNPYQINNWQAEHPHGLAMLWTRDYNEGVDLADNVIRVSSWEEILSLIEDHYVPSIGSRLHP